jgi:VIT1/CCC1 family predicted Fe2+/Mn2+ transporter
MYLMNVLFERGHSRNVFMRLKNAKTAEKASILKEEIQPVVADVMDDDEAGKMADKIIRLPEPPSGILLTGRDFLSALQIFFLVFLCTLPVALPFGLVGEAATGLRLSNGIALLMLFIGGYQLARFSGFSRFITGFVYMLIGVVLVAITIALGG